jgi:23S rRNA (uracil747-C5)-methyltransferase
VKCAYHRSGACRSCTWIARPYAEQVAAKQDAVVRALAAAGVTGAEGIAWLPPATSAPAGFRTKAKMAVGGTTDRPTLGVLDAGLRGVDLSACPIMAPPLTGAMPGLSRFIRQTGLLPYDVPRRRGELKYILATCADDGALLIRFVLRSRRQLGTLRRGLPLLRELVPGATVVTANIHPTHEAIIEGPEEVVLTDAASLPMPVGDVVLRVGPRSFTQTNTAVASQLYRQASAWLTGRAPAGGTDGAAPGAPRELWDLYCGVGGFALHAARAGVPAVTGIEISGQAIDSAREAAAGLGLPPDAVRFVAADATRWARSQGRVPDAVVVNPPRRGIGEDLAGWLDGSEVARVVYSSCFPATLASDLAAMPRLRPVSARLFDMFPHTAHAEVAVLLRRAA